MTDLNKIIAGAKSIERILTEQFGGAGRGLREKLDSARYPIPQPLQQRIAYLARMRNRSVHEEGFELNDSEDYLRKCQAVCAELQQVHAIAMRVAQEQAQKKAHGRRRQGSAITRLVMLALALAAAWWVLRPSPPGPPAPADPYQQAAGSAPAPATPAAVGKPAEARRDSRASAEAAPKQRTTPTPAASASSAGNIGLGNDVLALDAVEFGYAKGSFDRLEPRITVTVRNTSERTISSAMLDARLYVNGESTPVVETGIRRGLGERALYLGLGDNGLAPGASATSRISLFGNDSFSVPDAINGAQRILVLRVAEVSDGRRQTFGGAAPAWPAIGEREAVALRPAQPTLDAAAYRERFEAGEHVVLGDSRLEVSKLALRLEKDRWGKDKVGIYLDLTNRSGATLANAVFGAQLFVKGEQAPLAESGRRPLYAFFGKNGLADGASASAGNISRSSLGEWDAPDVLNAVRDGRAQLVLRLESLTDGRNRSHDSAAIGLNRR